MAKSLGMIHTVNVDHTNVTSATINKPIDLPGELSRQLQRTIRAGTYHKLVGIDMSLDAVGLLGGGQITGHFRYFAPTKGRCEAFRGAFEAAKNVFQMQGIQYWKNPLYDFRVALNDGIPYDTFANAATLDGDANLVLRNTTNAQDSSSVFGVHNEAVRPQYEGTDSNLYTAGFKTVLSDLQTTPTDFVRNDTVLYTGNDDFASLEYEKIPFMMSWTPDTTDIATTFQWRPDPALFSAILCGQLEMVIEEINLDGTAPALNIRMAFHVAGWKSIMGRPDQKKKSGKSRKSMSSKKSKR
ncbi:MAG: hypothetical protein [Circular genetic element sp.]|nr:MAG: hypothetical protein [Circular genetic element sp.]